MRWKCSLQTLFIICKLSFLSKESLHSSWVIFGDDQVHHRKTAKNAQLKANFGHYLVICGVKSGGSSHMDHHFQLSLSLVGLFPFFVSFSNRSSANNISAQLQPFANNKDSVCIYADRLRMMLITLVCDYHHPYKRNSHSIAQKKARDLRLPVRLSAQCMNNGWKPTRNDSRFADPLMSKINFSHCTGPPFICRIEADTPPPGALRDLRHDNEDFVV